MSEIAKTYDASACEHDIYRMWEESGYFNPDNLPGNRTQTFCTIMPPPNANGRLHAGHGLDMTLKDLMIRYKRMQGYKALFVPGADHAGFETQIVYERKLEQEGKTRFDMQPQELYDNILAFTLENKKHMENDIRRMGASCDWSRAKFTLDPAIVAQAQKTFAAMHADGLVYRGSRIVNWCSKHQTSLSDVETEFQEQNDPFYYFQYGPFVIGTARPETKFGDKYVVVHPADERYKDFVHGQTFELEWINGPVTATVLKDEAIDMEFGTGAMTITPWHDPIDFDLAQKHTLSMEQVIDFDGNLLPIAGEFAGKNAIASRAEIIAKLEKKGLLVRVENDYKHSVKVCYKCSTSIEPQVKEQWFVKMKPLAEIAMQAVREEKISFLPKRFEKIFFHWMENTIDWNISRQIVWGIPIPAKICDACHLGFPDLKDALHQCSQCQGKLRQDTDTFDTWFSSGQWPLLALGYPDSSDFANYYPTDIMETGADLVFKWVPRMIMFGMYLAKKEPFKTVYFHGMINDEHNQKMSKSKGNVISPVELSDRYGTDAMRMALVIGNGPGNSIPLSYQKVESYRNFANKLWNIGRYVLTQSETQNTTAQPQPASEADRWILAKLDQTIAEVTKHLDEYRFSMAGEMLRDFTWNDFADWYIEIHKIEKNDSVLRFVFETLLKLWHPFTPFVSEALWQEATDKSSLLMIQTWPQAQNANSEDTFFFENVIKPIITGIRTVRANYHIEPAKLLDIDIVAPNDTQRLSSQEALIKKFARIESISLVSDPQSINTEGAAYIAVEPLSVFVRLEGAIDIEKEKNRLTQEIEKTERFISNTQSRLANAKFVEQAPADIVSQTKDSLQSAQIKLVDLQNQLQQLS